ncbi:MAG: putative membrane protein [Gammaproteobacteria bacterium]|nr:MAG: putative membrane protein [Gammaproteobacteria bacterium]
MIPQTATTTTALRDVTVGKLLRNTYWLLSMTLLWSAALAALSTALKMPPVTHLVALGAAFVLIWFVLPRTARSAAGLWTVFAITGLLGFGLGPVLSAYLALPNGPTIVAMALGGTAVIFLGLSAYAIASGRDFSFLGGFVMVGFLVVLGAALVALFLPVPLLTVAISAAVVLLMSAAILFQTSLMLHHAEHLNYIEMTVSLYLAIFNLFISLLQLLGLARDE